MSDRLGAAPPLLGGSEVKGGPLLMVRQLAGSNPARGARCVIKISLARQESGQKYSRRGACHVI